MQDILRKYTIIDIQPNSNNLSTRAYGSTTSTMSIIKNRGGGDCFFISIADAINYYNLYNQNNRIFSGIYGISNNAYTQLYLRSLVFDFLNENYETFKTILTNQGVINSENLNQIFEQTVNAIGHELSNEEYVNIARDIYTSHDNFMVKNVRSIPILIDDYYTPFKRVIEMSDMEIYILSSDYWGNFLTLLALSTKLKLCFILINKTKKGENPFYSISYDNFKNNLWTKYLFIYDTDGHFELIKFSYKNKIQTVKENTTTSKTITITKTMFNKNEVPPIYLLFLIYGSSYSVFEQQSRYKFVFYNKLMKTIDNIIKQYLLTNQDINYYNTFKYYFPDSKIEKPIINSVNDIQSGGVIINKNYLLSKPYAAERLMKKETDKSKISYYITIDMELHPGKTMTPDELKKIKCRQKWNAVRKAYARFVGKPYIIPPVYQNTTVRNKEENKTNKTVVNKYNKSNNNNNTKNYRQKINRDDLKNKNFTLKNK